MYGYVLFQNVIAILYCSNQAHGSCMFLHISSQSFDGSTFGKSVVGRVVTLVRMFWNVQRISLIYIPLYSLLSILCPRPDQQWRLAHAISKVKPAQATEPLVACRYQMQWDAPQQIFL